jgi:hypothetical protein
MNRNRRPTLAWLAFVVVGFVPATANAQLAQQTASAVLDAPPAANDVWPGYVLPQRSWLVFDQQGAVLVTSSRAPATFSGPPAGALSGRPGVYWREGPPAAGADSLDVRFAVGDLPGTAIAVRRDLNATLEFLYHEAFHTFQHERFAGHAPADLNGVGPLSAEYAASVEVERRLLREALKTEPDHRAQLLREIVAVRAMRGTTAGGTVGTIESAVERHEGMARYVATRVVAALQKKPAGWPREQIAAELATPLRAFIGDPAERLIRSRAYATGAAIGLLLDAVESSWKQRVERGETPAGVLASLVSLSAADAASTATRALDRHGYPKSLTTRPAPWGSLITITEGDFLRLSSYRLSVEVAATAPTQFGMRSSFPLSEADRPRGIQRPADGLTILLDLTRFSISDPSSGVEAVAIGRPVSTDTRGKSDRQIITILLDAMPMLNGSSPTAGTVELDGCRVVGAGVELKISGPVSVTVDATSIRVVPTKRLFSSQRPGRR